MDEILRVFISVILTIVTILLGLIANGIVKIYDKQKLHDTAMATMNQSLEEVMNKVKNIYEWKDRIQIEELKDLKETVAKYRAAANESN